MRHFAVQHHRFGDLATNLPGRVERRHRILKDHRVVVATQLAHFVLAEADKITPVELDGSGRDVTDAGQQLHDRQSRGGLPAT
jgi:hypothetical protein